MAKAEKRTRTRVKTRRGVSQVIASILLFVVILAAGSVLVYYAYTRYNTMRASFDRRIALAEAVSSVRITKVYEYNGTVLYFAVSSRPLSLATNETAYIIKCDTQCTEVQAGTISVNGTTYYVVPVDQYVLFKTSSTASVYVVASFYGQYALGEVIRGG